MRNLLLLLILGLHTLVYEDSGWQHLLCVRQLRCLLWRNSEQIVVHGLLLHICSVSLHLLIIVHRRGPLRNWFIWVLMLYSRMDGNFGLFRCHFLYCEHFYLNILFFNNNTWLCHFCYYFDCCWCLWCYWFLLLYFLLLCDYFDFFFRIGRSITFFLRQLRYILVLDCIKF